MDNQGNSVMAFGEIGFTEGEEVKVYSGYQNDFQDHNEFFLIGRQAN